MTTDRVYNHRGHSPKVLRLAAILAVLPSAPLLSA